MHLKYKYKEGSAPRGVGTRALEGLTIWALSRYLPASALLSAPSRLYQQKLAPHVLSFMLKRKQIKASLHFKEKLQHFLIDNALDSAFDDCFFLFVILSLWHEKLKYLTNVLGEGNHGVMKFCVHSHDGWTIIGFDT